MKNSSLIQSLFSLAFLPSMSLLAGDHHLFPSDIIDQSEQAMYDQEREARYNSERQWTFPDKSEILRANNPKHFNPEAHQYISNDGQPMQNLPQARDHGFSRYPESERFEYSQPVRRQAFNPSMNQMVKPDYPNESLLYKDNGSYKPAARSRPNNYPQTQYPPQRAESYGSSGYYDSMNSRGTHSDVLFPGDVEPNTQSYNQRYESINYRTEASERSNEPGEQIRYVPVPVYNVPGTLPGTVPGMITPSNMVPGYSHLNPYGNNQAFNSAPFNHYGMNNMWGTPYSPFSGFPGVGNPFNSLYNNNGNSFSTWPFSNPGMLMPGVSMPDMISKPKSYR